MRDYYLILLVFEFTGSARVDYLSNGFKVRYPGAGNPNIVTTYVYCAWAEAPAFNLYGGQSMLANINN